MTELKSPFEERPEPESPKPAPVKPVLPQPLSPPSPPRPQHRPRSVFWPIILIGAGVLLLLSNMGLFPATGWAVLWQFWPLALVALGIDVLISRRTVGGAVASGILLLLLLGFAIGVAFFAEQIPALVELTKPAILQHEHVESPVAGLESATVTIDWTSAPGYLSALKDSSNLIEADVAYRGELAFNVTKDGDHADVLLDSYLQGISYGTLDFNDREAEWDVKLSPDVALDLWLDTSSGSTNLNLTGLDITHLSLDSGSGSVRLTLPAASSFEGVIDSGSGSVTIVLPENVGMRVRLESGSGSFRPDDRFELISGEENDDGIWETKNFATADDKLTLDIDQGSGSIRIE